MANNNDSRMLQMMKAALPFLPESSVGNLAQYIRMIEITNTLSRLDREEEELLSSCSLEGEDREAGLYQAVRTFCSPREQEMLDLFMNFSQLSRLQREFESDESTY